MSSARLSLIAFSRSKYTASFTSVPGKMSLISASNRWVSRKVSLASVFRRTALMTSSISIFISIEALVLFSIWMSFPLINRIVLRARSPQS